MRTATMMGLAAVGLMLAVGSAYGDLGQPNDISPYGDFELDLPGTGQPTGWDSHWGDTVVRPIPPVPSPVEGQVYGLDLWLDEMDGASGGIDIDVLNPEPDWMEKQIYVGAYVATLDPFGWQAEVRFSLHMDPDPQYLPDGLNLYSEWYDSGGGGLWQWKEWLVTEVEPGVPLPCLDFNVDIEFRAMNPFPEGGVFRVFVDGVNVQHICIPEPATLSLLALGGLAMLRRRR